MKLSATEVRELPHTSLVELADFQGTIAELKAEVNKLELLYGKDAVVYFDAGFNNIEARVVPRQIIDAYENPKTARTPAEDPVKTMQTRKDITRLKNLLAKYGVPK